MGHEGRKTIDLLHAERGDEGTARAAVLRNTGTHYPAAAPSAPALLVVGRADFCAGHHACGAVSSWGGAAVGMDGLPMIYLDNAATTLHKPSTIGAAMQEALLHAASAGRSSHAAALRAAEILYETREMAAKLFELEDPARVVFTTNATEALNTAIFAMSEHAERFAVTGIEHNAVLRPMHRLASQGKRVKILDTPMWQPEHLMEQLQETCRRGLDCLVVNQVSNVFGYRLPLEQIDERDKWEVGEIGVVFIGGELGWELKRWKLWI